MAEEVFIGSRLDGGSPIVGDPVQTAEQKGGANMADVKNAVAAYVENDDAAFQERAREIAAQKLPGSRVRFHNVRYVRRGDLPDPRAIAAICKPKYAELLQAIYEKKPEVEIIVVRLGDPNPQPRTEKDDPAPLPVTEKIPATPTPETIPTLAPDEEAAAQRALDDIPIGGVVGAGGHKQT